MVLGGGDRRALLRSRRPLLEPHRQAVRQLGSDAGDASATGNRGRLHRLATMASSTPAALERTLRQARLAQAITVGWMVIEGAVAVSAGLVARSVALTAFGVDSFIELLTAAVVLRLLFQRSAAEERGSLTDGERSASRFVGWALYLLIAYIVVTATAGAALGIRAAGSSVGIGLSLVSIVIMTILWRWRLTLADRLGSQRCMETQPALSCAFTWPLGPWLAWLSTIDSDSGGRIRSPGLLSSGGFAGSK